MTRFRTGLAIIIISISLNQPSFAMDRLPQRQDGDSSAQYIVFPTMLLVFLPLIFQNLDSLQSTDEWVPYILRTLPSDFELSPDSVSLVVDENCALLEIATTEWTQEQRRAFIQSVFRNDQNSGVESAFRMHFCAAECEEIYDFLFLFFSQREELKLQYELLSREIARRGIKMNELHELRVLLGNPEHLQVILKMTDFLQVNVASLEFATINCSWKLVKAALKALFEGRSFSTFLKKLEVIVNQQIFLVYMNDFVIDYLEEIRSVCCTQTHSDTVSNSNENEKNNGCCNLL